MNEDLYRIYSGILLSHDKDELLPFVTAWMEFESFMLNKKQ